MPFKIHELKLRELKQLKQLNQGSQLVRRSQGFNLGGVSPELKGFACSLQSSSR